MEKYLIVKFHTGIECLIKYQKCFINYPSKVHTINKNFFNKLLSEHWDINY